jgi:hypothetical protein
MIIYIILWILGGILAYIIRRKRIVIHTWEIFLKYLIFNLICSWFLVLIYAMERLTIPLQGKPPKWL